MTLAGLSPRARGSRCRLNWSSAPYPRGRGEAAYGLTAGVYPRGRGEATSGSSHSGDHHGVYPRGRGEANSPQEQSGAGSIPAGAGKPTPSMARRGQAGLSPRARGSLVIEPILALLRGLSPRARGSPRTPRIPRRIYPRGRGEATVATPRRSGRLGSIPAGAGKPRSTADQGVHLGLSPRARGSRCNLGGRSRGAGLSPRARGSRCALLLLELGLSPRARGSPGRDLQWSPRVYPRGRGEAVP